MFVFMLLIESDESCGVDLKCCGMMLWCGVYYGFVFVLLLDLFFLWVL